MTKRGFARLDPSAFAGFRFPLDVITLAVRWYLRFGPSYRDVEELLVERGIEVDHVSVYRWVQRFTPLFFGTPPTGGTCRRLGSSSAQPWPRPVIPSRSRRTGRRPIGGALDELLPAVHHVVAQYANNSVECDHGRLKSRLRPMRGLKRRRSAIVVAAGHAFVQNIRRGHYELGLDVSPSQRVSVAFTELAVAL